jgi:hypothetical protein
MKKSNLTTAALCMAFLMGGACASELTGFFAVKQVVNVNEQVSLWVTGTAKCGVMIDDGNGNKLPIALTDPSPQPSKSFGVTYDHPATFTLTASPRTGTDVVCAPQAAPLTLQIEVLGPATGLLAPANGTKTNVPASTNPSEKPPCAQDEAAQARQLKAGNKVDICPPKSETPPTCFKSKAEQSEYSKKNNPKTVPLVCK